MGKPASVAAASRRRPAPRFPVVGLGASAGGLEALCSFFDALPANTGAAFVVIQHLSPGYSSQMVQLLSSHSLAPVRQIEDGMTIEPNRVHVIPPGKGLKIVRGELWLSEPQNGSRAPRSPIDHFFRSLAKECGELAVAISLSGTGSDGTLGIRAIKKAGGLVMVQDDESAKFSSMPDHAGATGLADYILPPREMAGELVKFFQHPSAVRPMATSLALGDASLRKIISLIRDQTGTDFSGYKPTSMVRRIERRIGIAQLTKFEDYLELLEQSTEEVAALGRDLLINVTRFFRDDEVFAALRDDILPRILNEAAQEKRLRIWVPGCATGEEAYSIALLVEEHLLARGETWDVKIFATDMDMDSIVSAGHGYYLKSIVADVPPHLLARFFVEENSGFRISQEIREMVLFAQQSILRDPPFTKVDLISCRNLLIYLSPESQRKVISLLHFALRSGGYLLLGTSEAIAEQEYAFETVDAKLRIFRKCANSAPAMAPIVGLQSDNSVLLDAAVRLPAPANLRPKDAEAENFFDAISAKLMAQSGTTCLVLDARHEILRSFGEPERFLASRSTHAGVSLRKRFPRALSLPLLAALRQAASQRQTVVHSGLRLIFNGRTEIIDLTVEPLPAANGTGGIVLVFLQPTKALHSSEMCSPAAESAGRIAELENELEKTKESLALASEEKETAQEQLQATNEELLAGNEELQTSNEELQSVNRELTKLNQQYRGKITELIVSHTDLENFLRTSDIAILSLDDALRLRRFTPAAAREFSLQPHDIGRLLTDCQHPLVPSIAEDARTVSAGEGTVIKSVQATAGVRHLMRISRYRGEPANDRGLIVTILDISAVPRAIYAR